MLTLFANGYNINYINNFYKLIISQYLSYQYSCMAAVTVINMVLNWNAARDQQFSNMASDRLAGQPMTFQKPCQKMSIRRNANRGICYGRQSMILS